MLRAAQAEDYLSRIRQIKSVHTLVDMHVHPFEVVFNDLSYQKNSSMEGVYSSREASYSPPGIAEERSADDLPASCRRLISETVRHRCLRIAMQQLYKHTGTKVLTDHMDLSGIDQVLLLPVSRPGSSPDTQLEMMARMFGGDPRFLFGYSVPNAVNYDDLSAVIATAVERYGIKAIKIHPAITGIDPKTPSGRARIEKILVACHENGLSVIIHGGRSPDVVTPVSADFGELARLELVDWSLTDTAVVIAHAGVYGYEQVQIEPVVKTLRRILERHDNVMIDLSAVQHATLCRLLKEISADRIVFGSDSLYFPQWRCLAALYHALEETCAGAEESFLKIASTNPQRIIMEGKASYRLPANDLQFNPLTDAG
ncbi:MAG: amidohydrolase family protein [Desulfuromonadales bacterium]|nr:amidohydrolase family protein [Desulfuromonadales bacterium]